MIYNFFKKRREKQESLNSLLDQVTELNKLVDTLNKDHKEMYLLLNETAQRKTDTQQNSDYQENKLSDYLLDFDDSCIEEYIDLQKKSDTLTSKKKKNLYSFIIIILIMTLFIRFDNIIFYAFKDPYPDVLSTIVWIIFILFFIFLLLWRIFQLRNINFILYFCIPLIIFFVVDLLFDLELSFSLWNIKFQLIYLIFIFLVPYLYMVLVNKEKYSIYNKVLEKKEKYSIHNKSLENKMEIEKKKKEKKIIIFLKTHLSFLIPYKLDLTSSKYYKHKLLSDCIEDCNVECTGKNYISIKKKKKKKKKNKDKVEYKIFLENWALHRIRRKFFIEFSNWNNLSLTIYITIFTYIIYLFYIYLDSSSKMILIYIISILIIRLLSRSYEIILSFYKDIVSINSNFLYLYDEEKNNHISYYINNIKYSLIRSPGRLSLAIHSLIEIIIVCSGIYFFMDFYNANTNILYSPDSNDNNLKPSNYQIDNGHTLDTPLKALLYSTSLGVFNISFDSTKGLIWSFIHVTQVLSSVILILLSIAQYLGSDKELSPKEAGFYKACNEKDNQKDIQKDIQKDNKK